MEAFLSLFVNHDTVVVASLVVVITIIVVLLVLYTQKNPESVVRSELGGAENIEGALRRVLGEKQWAQAGDGEGVSDSQLHQELLEKDRTIADLNKQLTQSGSGGGASGDDSDLLARIQELEGRLEEYEIIEDDIADLSLYKNENEKLKDELARLKSQLGGESVTPEPDATGATVVVDEPEIGSEEEAVAPVVEEPPQAAVTQVPGPSKGAADAADLVAEFEKVVNNQEQISSDDEVVSSKVGMEPEEPGKVLIADEFAPKKVVQEEPEVHPKLRSVSPDSKEEAEVFIAELKSLKGLKKGS